jgi:CheY-like chemotaxis protein/HPt (histidine-containing phosphotransfer) domain-containing protein
LQECELFEQQQQQRQASAQSQIASNQLLAGTAILVVEDNSLNQQVAREFLELLGAEIKIAENGQDALVWLENKTFAAVLMDVHMPIMGGEEATEIIRKQQRFVDLPIIALSAGVTKEERNRCLASGMNDFVSKPIMPDELISILVKWIKPAHPQPSQQSSTPKPKPKPDKNLAVNLPGFELNNLLRMVNGNWQTVIKLLVKFKENHADTLEILDKQLGSSDYAQAQKTVHDIKGVSGNIGANYLFETANNLEKECHSKEVHHSTLEAFRTEFMRVMTVLETLTVT